jgi:hypothetical protein
MHQKLDLLKGRHSTGACMPDEKPIVHSTLATAQLDELPAIGDGTLDTQDATSESWDATLGTGNAGSRNADVELASMHDPDTGL